MKQTLCLFAALLLLATTLPLTAAFAADSEYQRVRYGEGSQTNTMGYWDDNQFARQMVTGTGSQDTESSGAALRGFGGMSPANTLNYCSQQTGAVCQSNPVIYQPSNLQFRSSAAANDR